MACATMGTLPCAGAGAAGIWLMQVLAPRVAHSAQPGQFVIVRVDEHGERIPLTISDFDPAQAWHR